MAPEYSQNPLKIDYKSDLYPYLNSKTKVEKRDKEIELGIF